MGINMHYKEFFKYFDVRIETDCYFFRVADEIGDIVPHYKSCTNIRMVLDLFQPRINKYFLDDLIGKLHELGCEETNLQGYVDFCDANEIEYHVILPYLANPRLVTDWPYGV